MLIKLYLFTVILSTNLSSLLVWIKLLKLVLIIVLVLWLHIKLCLLLIKLLLKRIHVRPLLKSLLKALLKGLLIQIRLLIILVIHRRKKFTLILHLKIWLKSIVELLALLLTLILCCLIRNKRLRIYWICSKTLKDVFLRFLLIYYLLLLQILLFFYLFFLNFINKTIDRVLSKSSYVLFPFWFIVLYFKFWSL